MESSVCTQLLVKHALSKRRTYWVGLFYLWVEQPFFSACLKPCCGPRDCYPQIASRLLPHVRAFQPLRRSQLDARHHVRKHSGHRCDQAWDRRSLNRLSAFHPGVPGRSKEYFVVSVSDAYRPPPLHGVGKRSSWSCSRSFGCFGCFINLGLWASNLLVLVFGKEGAVYVTWFKKCKHIVLY